MWYYIWKAVLRRSDITLNGTLFIIIFRAFYTHILSSRVFVKIRIVAVFVIYGQYFHWMYHGFTPMNVIDKNTRSHTDSQNWTDIYNVKGRLLSMSWLSSY